MPNEQCLQTNEKHTPEFITSIFSKHIRADWDCEEDNDQNDQTYCFQNSDNTTKKD